MLPGQSYVNFSWFPWNIKGTGESCRFGMVYRVKMSQCKRRLQDIRVVPIWHGFQPSPAQPSPEGLDIAVLEGLFWGVSAG